MRAACAATELARLPVEAQAMRSKPSSRAAVIATDTTRSLNEWVGLAESSLTHSGAVKPSSSAEPVGADQRRHAGAGVDAGRRVLADRQQPGVAPERVRAGLDLVARDAGERGGVVADLERARSTRSRRAARRAGRWRRSCDRRARTRARARWAGQREQSWERGLSPHLSRRGSRAGRSWHLRRRPRVDERTSDASHVVAGASSGRSLCPSG